MAKMPTSNQLLAETPASFPDKGWMDIKAEFIPGRYPYPAKAETMEKMGFVNAHTWAPEDEDWNLPENWEEILYNGLKERLEKHRSLKFSWILVYAAALVLINATSSLVPMIQKICLCSVQNFCAPFTAKILLLQVKSLVRQPVPVL